MPILANSVLSKLFLLLSALKLTSGAPSTPPPTTTSNVVTTANQPRPRIPDGYHAWNIDEAESARLSKLLGVDFSTLNMKGTIVDGPKEKCEGCGKESGFDDIVNGVSLTTIFQTTSTY
jgi:hypothetical protein